MTRFQNNFILIAMSMFLASASGCVGAADTGSGDFPTASEETQPASSRHSPISGAGTITTGTATPHLQKNSPVKIERVTSEMLEQAGATHVGQSLQDVPGIQLRR